MIEVVCSILRILCPCMEPNKRRKYDTFGSTLVACENTLCVVLCIKAHQARQPFGKTLSTFKSEMRQNHREHPLVQNPVVGVHAEARMQTREKCDDLRRSGRMPSADTLLAHLATRDRTGRPLILRAIETHAIIHAVR